MPEDEYLDYDLPVDTGTVGRTGTLAPTEHPTEPHTSPLPTREIDTATEETPVETEVPMLHPTTTTTTTSYGTRNPSLEDEPEELCSRKPFNAFTDLKNGSLYAFRGTHSPFSGSSMFSLPPGAGHSAPTPLFFSLPREILL